MMKGQVNLEFIAAATLFLIVAGGLLISSSNVLPGLSDQVEKTDLYSKAYTESTKFLSRPGSGNSVGISTSSENYLVVDPSKLSLLTEYSPSAENTVKITYSEFKKNNSVDNQFHFNFTWNPILETEGTISRFGSSSIKISGGDNLIGYWPLDKTVKQSPPEIKDISGDSNPGQPAGDIEYNTSGIRGVSSNHFTSEAHFYVNNGFNNNQNTVSFWMKPDDLAKTENLIRFNNPSGGSLTILKDGDELSVKEISGGTTKNYYDVDLNQGWSHVVLTVSSSGDYDIYINGKLKANGENGQTLNQIDTKETYIGAKDGKLGNNEGFEGKLDNIRVYSSRLSSSKINKIYRGRDKYTKEPKQKIIEPDDTSYVSSANKVRFGRERLLNDFIHFLVISHDGDYDQIYTSNTWNFSSESPTGIGQILNTRSGRFYELKSISNRGNSDGKALVLKQYKKSFGPEPSESGSVVRLERFVSYRGEPMKVVVLSW